MKRVLFASVLLSLSTGTFAVGPPDGQNVNVVNPSLDVEVQNFPESQGVNVTNLPETQNVRITNDAINVNTQTHLPFCACFSTAEIDDYLLELADSGTTVSCGDDRAATLATDRAVTFIRVGDALHGRSVVVTSNDGGATWRCSLQLGSTILPPPSPPIPVPFLLVDFQNVSFADAMACRPTIMNSQTWAGHCGPPEPPF